MPESTKTDIVDENQLYKKISFAELDYKTQLTYKQKHLSLLLAKFYSDDLDVFSSPPKHYRMRAEFRVWHDGDDTYHIMFNQSTKAKYRVDQLPAASEIINQAMLATIDFIKSKPLLRGKLFQIDYLSTTSNELVISLLYHKPLEDDWHACAVAMQSALSNIASINIIGRSKKQKRVIGNDYVMETMCINGQNFSFKQIENSFTQPNAHINVQMIEWVIEHCARPESDLLELYCGAGNFSVPLSKHFNRVLATEISKTSVAAAQDNIRQNDIHNLTIARLSSEEFVEAYKQTRTFNRLANIQLNDYRFNTVLVDPPRAGLDEATLALIAQFENIIYISCNPSTLTDNLEVLTHTHTVTKTALFDQFPFTSHMESGVILKRKKVAMT